MEEESFSKYFRPRWCIYSISLENFSKNAVKKNTQTAFKEEKI